MKTKRLYIADAAQISIQQPLCEAWMEEPIRYAVPYTRSIDPDFRSFFTPLEARRMGKVLKRALAASMQLVQRADGGVPDAIITGTGLGCTESTERFLTALCEEGEQLLKPTHFMQSTHNTISSLLAIHFKCHGYNVTYAHKGISFDSALFDAWVQLRMGRIGSALVGGHEEITPSYFTLLRRIGYVGGATQEVCGETSVALLLRSATEETVNEWTRKPLCELAGTTLLYDPSPERMRQALDRLLRDAELDAAAIDGVVTGVNGNPANDGWYASLLPALLPAVPTIRYKHIFGESYAVSGLGLYAAAHCLDRGFVPAFMYDRTIPPQERPTPPHNLLIINQSDGKTASLTLLRAVGPR